jgi:hypothetical protein
MFLPRRSSSLGHGDLAAEPPQEDGLEHPGVFTLEVGSPNRQPILGQPGVSPFTDRLQPGMDGGVSEEPNGADGGGVDELAGVGRTCRSSSGKRKGPEVACQGLSGVVRG